MAGACWKLAPARVDCIPRDADAHESNSSFLRCEIDLVDLAVTCGYGYDLAGMSRVHLLPESLKIHYVNAIDLW